MQTLGELLNKVKKKKKRTVIDKRENVIIWNAQLNPQKAEKVKTKIRTWATNRK